MRPVFLLIFAMLLVAGCVHRADPGPVQYAADRTMVATFSARFVVRGNILAADGTPVGYAEAYFTDLGLDYHWGKEGLTERIGTADGSSKLDQHFSYGWCTEMSFKGLGLEVPDFSGENEDDRFLEALLEAWSDAKILQPFAIEIRAEGFKPHRVEFDLTQLPEPDGPHVLELGTITLDAKP